MNRPVTWKERMIGILFSLVLLAVGAFSYTVGSNQQQIDRDLDTHGQSVPAIITIIGGTSTKRSTNMVSYRYNVAGTDFVGSSEVAHRDVKNLQIRDSVTALYLTGNPVTSKLSQVHVDHYYDAWILIGRLFIFAAALVLCLTISGKMGR